MEAEFSVTCRSTDDGSYVVTVVGELDVGTVPAFREFLLALDGEVELDCAGLGFLDSAGLGELVAYYRRLGSTGGQLKLTNLSEACWRVLEITGLTEMLQASRAATR
jgi:anti-sigma B factor antagonist